jgi:hypothetical protein
MQSRSSSLRGRRGVARRRSSRGSRERRGTPSIASLCNKSVNRVASALRGALPSGRVRSKDNALRSLRGARAGLGAVDRTSGLGLGVARRRPRAARVLGRRRQVRGRPASRDRRRPRRCCRRARARIRRRHLRRPGSNERTHGDDCDRGRLQGVAHASRHASREERRARDGRRADRRRRPVGRDRARRAVRPPRDQAGLRRRLRRSPHPASAARCPQPSPGTRGAARTCTTTRPGGAAGRCEPSRSSSSGSRSATGGGTGSPGCERPCHADCVNRPGQAHGRRRSRVRRRRTGEVRPRPARGRRRGRG